MSGTQHLLAVSFGAAEADQAAHAIELSILAADGPADAAARLDGAPELRDRPRGAGDYALTPAAAGALREMLEGRFDELSADLVERGTPAWKASARLRLAETGLAIVAVRRALGDDVDGELE